MRAVVPSGNTSSDSPARRTSTMATLPATDQHLYLDLTAWQNLELFADLYAPQNMENMQGLWGNLRECCISELHVVVRSRAAS